MTTDRRSPQTPAQQAASPHRRAFDDLRSKFTEAHLHNQAMMEIRLRGGRLMPLPACFRGERDE